MRIQRDSRSPDKKRRKNANPVGRLGPGRKVTLYPELNKLKKTCKLEASRANKDFRRQVIAPFKQRESLHQSKRSTNANVSPIGQKQGS